MHLLCHTLNQLGFKAFLVPIDKRFEVNSSLETPILTKELRDRHLKLDQKTISVFDESILMDPLNGTVSVRWLLNRAGFLGGKTFSKDDAKVIEFVLAKEIDPCKERLSVSTVDFNFFRDSFEGKERSLKLFYGGKLRSLGVEIRKPDNTVEIFRSGSRKQTREDLRELFYRSKVLYLAEDSALALEAAICGCPTVHLKEYFDFEPLSQEDGGVGLAKSDSPLDLQRVNLSRDFIESYMYRLQIRSLRDVLNFSLLVESQVNQSIQIKKTRYKISRGTKVSFRIWKLLAGYRKSGLRGLFGVFLSHINLKAGDRERR